MSLINKVIVTQPNIVDQYTPVIKHELLENPPVSLMMF